MRNYAHLEEIKKYLDETNKMLDSLDLELDWIEDLKQFEEKFKSIPEENIPQEDISKLSKIAWRMWYKNSQTDFDPLIWKIQRELRFLHENIRKEDYISIMNEKSNIK